MEHFKNKSLKEVFGSCTYYTIDSQKIKDEIRAEERKKRLNALFKT